LGGKGIGVQGTADVERGGVGQFSGEGVQQETSEKAEAATGLLNTHRWGGKGIEVRGQGKERESMSMYGREPERWGCRIWDKFTTAQLGRGRL
jgi:hypothetical protein